MEFNFNPAQDKTDPLKDFGRNLTDLAAQNKLEPVIGRDNEIRRIIRILARKTKNNPVLVGEPGVGKTAIVEGLAIKIVSGDVPENLKDREIIEIDMGSMIAGASFQGQFEKRIKDLLKKVEESDGKIMLFIDEIHTLVGTGKNAEGSLDAAQMLKPLLARGALRLIGATTNSEYRKYIEKDAALERRMQKVTVNEPSEEEAITILRGIKQKLENYHNVKITDNAIVQSVKLSARYISDRFLPDKAIDLVDEAAAAIQTEMHSKPEKLEKIEQKLAMLKMEKAALASEKDVKSKTRLNEIEQKIQIEEKEHEKVKGIWEKEKNIVKRVGEIQNKIEAYKMLMNRYQVEGEFEKASILLYKEIPALEKELEVAEKESLNKTGLVKELVTQDEIADIVSKWTQIPVNKLLQQEKEKILGLEKMLQMRIKGQNEALGLIAEAIIRSKADINDPRRPIGSFIFMGPTGVGKTEVAKALAHELFDSERQLVRIDMTEYMEQHSVARLIGSPPGYIGHDEGGQLTEAIRRNPYSIILFDEIEKAHPKVLDLLLQVLDDGILTDSKGREVNFKNTIIILTTNIAALDILEGTKSDDKIKAELKKHLRPEFINRIDEIIIFKALSPVAIKQIVQVELEKLSKRIEEKNIYVSFGDQVIEKIIADSYDLQFGARPIKRYIQKAIESQLARKIISGEISEDNSYQMTIKDGKFEFINRKAS